MRLARSGQRGATAVEYSILASAIAAVIVIVVYSLGTKTAGLFQAALDAMIAAFG